MGGCSSSNVAGAPERNGPFVPSNGSFVPNRLQRQDSGKSDESWGLDALYSPRDSPRGSVPTRLESPRSTLGRLSENEIANGRRTRVAAPDSDEVRVDSVKLNVDSVNLGVSADRPADAQPTPDAAADPMPTGVPEAGGKAGADEQGHASSDVLEPGTRCWYEVDGERVLVTVIRVTVDDPPPYYSISMPNDSERNTVRSKLTLADCAEGSGLAAAAAAPRPAASTALASGASAGASTAAAPPRTSGGATDADAGEKAAPIPESAEPICTPVLNGAGLLLPMDQDPAASTHDPSSAAYDPIVSHRDCTAADSAAPLVEAADPVSSSGEDATNEKAAPKAPDVGDGR